MGRLTELANTLLRNVSGWGAAAGAERWVHARSGCAALHAVAS